MTAKPVRARPLSPHLQIYRWPITMASSILHRITGVGLGAGILVLAWQLIAAAMGPGPYETFRWAAGGILGQLVLFGFTVALVYHALNGVRHVAWNFGWGLNVPAADKSGIAVFVATPILSIAIWAIALFL